MMIKILTVEDIFFITGRGIVVTGWIEAVPMIKSGFEIEIIRPDKTKIESQIIGIERFRNCFGNETTRKNYGLLLKDIYQKEDIPIGSEIYVLEN